MTKYNYTLRSLDEKTGETVVREVGVVEGRRPSDAILEFRKRAARFPAPSLNSLDLAHPIEDCA